MTVAAESAATRPGDRGPDGVVRRDRDTAANRSLQALMVRRAVAGGDYPPTTGLRLATAREAQSVRALSGKPCDADWVSQTDRALCRFLAAALSRRGPDVHDYLGPMVRYGPQVSADAAHGCGQRLLRMTLTPRYHTAGGRELWLCERCGFAANLPVGQPYPRVARRPDGGFAVAVSPGPGWHTASLQPVGGHRERAEPVRPLRAAGAVLAAPIPPAGSPGVRRTAVAVVRSGDYEIYQAPIEPTAGE